MENFPRKILKLFMKKEIALEETRIELNEKEKMVREWVKKYKKLHEFCEKLKISCMRALLVKAS